MGPHVWARHPTSVTNLVADEERFLPARQDRKTRPCTQARTMSMKRAGFTLGSRVDAGLDQGEMAI